MASTFSTNLAIELIGTGDQAGTWGVTTNTNLGTLIEQAISGYVTQAVSTGSDTTITIPNGATGVARNMYIELTGTGGTNTNLIVPSNKKLYFIFNNTSSGQVTVKVSGQTGVSVPNGKKVILVCNGTDVVNGLNYIADFGTNSFTVTNLTASSGTITNLIATTGTITTLSATSGNISNLVSSDASATVLRAGSATLTHLSATSASITNLALTSLTISSLSITNVSVASATVSSNLTLSGGTANGVLYLNGSKVATSGSALTFNGTLFTNRPTSDANTNIARFGVINSAGTDDAFLNISADAANNLITLDSTGNNTGAFAFSTGGGEKMRLTAAGDLGIGTSSPDSNFKVTISGNSGAVSPGIYFDDQASSPKDYTLYINGSKNFVLRNQTDTANIWEATPAGNLGLGVTPSAWNSNRKAIQSGNASFFSAPSAASYSAVGANVFNNTSGTDTYISSAAASLYLQNAGVHSWYTAPSGTAGDTISFTQAMTLDASGNLGVGTTSPGARLDIRQSGTTQFYIMSTSATEQNNAIVSFFNNGGSYGNLNYDGAAHIFKTSGTERARITSGGDFCVGATSSSGSGASSGKQIIQFAGATGNGLYLDDTRTSAGADVAIIFGRGATAVGKIETTLTGMNYTVVANGAMTFATSDTERARITSAGEFIVNGTAAVNAAAGRGNITINGTTQAILNFTGSGVENGYVYHNGTNLDVYNALNNPLRFGTNNTERARITSGGDFLVGAASALASEGFTIVRSTGGNPVGAIRNGSATAGQYWIFGPNSSNNYILYNDDGNGVYILDGGTSWTSSSDERKKDIIEPIADAANKVASLRAVIGKYKTDAEGVRRSFLIAQDVKAVFPEAVDARNEDELGLSYTDTIPLLVAAIKEQQAMINELKAKVAALESK